MRFDQIVHPLTRRLRPFSDLRESFFLPNSAFYSYLQIRHLAILITRDFTFDRPTDFERLQKRGPTKRGMIYQTYKILLSLPLDPFRKHMYMLKWEEILGRELPLLVWQTLWSQAQHSSICNLYKENSYKILMCWTTPRMCYMLIYPSVSDRC